MKTEKNVGDVAQCDSRIAQFLSGGYLPSFACAAGLCKTYSYPKLIYFGPSLDLLHSVLSSDGELLDEQPVPDQGVGYFDFLADYTVRFLTVDKNWHKGYFGYGYWFNGTWDFPALQIGWPNKQALPPWGKGLDIDRKFKQPLLDRDTSFKFREERNAAVFITCQALEGLPILCVVHNAEGDR